MQKKKEKKAGSNQENHADRQGGSGEKSTSKPVSHNQEVMQDSWCTRAKQTQVKPTSARKSHKGNTDRQAEIVQPRQPECERGTISPALIPPCLCMGNLFTFHFKEKRSILSPPPGSNRSLRAAHYFFFTVDEAETGNSQGKKKVLKVIKNKQI